MADKEVSAISQRAQVANGNGELKTMVASNPYAIGYISLGTVDTSVHALAVNGVETSVDNVNSVLTKFLVHSLCFTNKIIHLLKRRNS